MKKIIIFLLFLYWFLYGVTIEVKQDGTGDYTQIQTAIENAVNGDTILVYHGIYYENINFNAKDIVVSSLYLVDENNEHINTTIIDGNHSGSCVRIVDSNNEYLMLCGFTLQNGSGSPCYEDYDLSGGGILIYNSSPIIKKCTIKNNSAFYGGGIKIAYRYNSPIGCPILKGNRILKNHAYYAGGGISIAYLGDVEFDPNNLNSVYLNTAGTGNDIIRGGIDPQTQPINVIVDTFTVMNPDNFYFSDHANSSFSCQHSAIEQVNSDLYVATDGDDNNSGLSPFEPLKTIARAYINIYADEDNPHTIHVASGTYSPSATGEKYGLNMKDYVSLQGVGENETFLDADYQSFLILGQDHEKKYTISDLTIMNHYETMRHFSSAIEIFQPRDVTIRNVTIRNCIDVGSVTCITTPRQGNTENTLEGNKLLLDNVTMRDNVGSCTAILSYIDDIVFNNFIVKNNTPNYNAEFIGGSAVAVGGLFDPERYVCKIYNSQFSNNIDGTIEWPNSPIAFEAMYNHTYMINCTIANNEGVEATNGGAISLSNFATLDLYNSIAYGNFPNQIFLENGNIYGGPSHLNIHNSLIENGEEGILEQPNNEVAWYGENLTCDPLFDSTGDYPFALSSTSPCIDAGTLDLPEGIELPETDLAGNPRVVGASVDMGAYEYQGGGSGDSQDDDLQVPDITNTLLSVYPNPFRISATKSEVTIKLELSKAGNIRLDIYNLKGQKIKTIMDAYASKGVYNSKWDCKDETGKKISSGMYLIKLTENGKITRVNRFTVVK